jgi:hypothetical protein
MDTDLPGAAPDQAPPQPENPTTPPAEGGADAALNTCADYDSRQIEAVEQWMPLPNVV